MKENENPRVVFSISANIELYKKIQGFEFKQNCKNRTEAVKRLINVGLWVFDNLKDFDTPQKAEEIKKMFDKKVKDEEFLGYVNTLSSSQQEAIAEYINSKKEQEN